MEPKRSSKEAAALTESLTAEEFEERTDREPKSKLREEGFDAAAIGADLPWGLNPNSLVKRPSKSFIVRRSVEEKLKREGSDAAVVSSVHGGSAGECDEEDTSTICL